MVISLGFALKTLGALASAGFAAYGSLNEPREPDKDHPGQTRPSRAARIGVVGAILGALLTVGVASSESVEANKQQQDLLTNIGAAQKEIMRAEARVKAVDEEVKKTTGILSGVQSDVKTAANNASDLLSQSQKSLKSLQAVVATQGGILDNQKKQNSLAATLNKSQETSNDRLASMVLPFKPIPCHISLCFQANDPAIAGAISTIEAACQKCIVDQHVNDPVRNTEAYLWTDVMVGSQKVSCFIGVRKGTVEDISVNGWQFHKTDLPVYKSLYYLFKSWTKFTVDPRATESDEIAKSQRPRLYTTELNNAGITIFPKLGLVQSEQYLQPISPEQGASQIGLPLLANGTFELMVLAGGPVPIVPKVVLPRTNGSAVLLFSDAPVQPLKTNGLPRDDEGVGLNLTWADYLDTRIMQQSEYSPRYRVLRFRITKESINY